MNDLDDLRTILDAHAADASGADVVTRRQAVHHRIGAVRRRRRVGAAGIAAAVVATVAGVTLLPAGDGDAGPDLAGPAVFGIDLPTELDSLGYRYVYADHVTGQEGRARLRLPASDGPRLVTWGTSGDDDAVRVSETGGGPGVVRDGGDFEDWVLVDAGVPVDVRVTVAEGRPALAVYDLGEERPEGVTGAGITFRQEIAGGELLAARVTDPGEADVTLDATAAGPGTLTVALCTGLDEGLTVHEETVGAGGSVDSSTSCGEPFPYDGLAGGSTAFTTQPGEDVTTRFWVTRGPDGPVVDDPDVRLALAVYSLDHDPLDGVPTEVERRGHTWRLVEGSAVTGDGTRTTSLEVPASAGVSLVRGEATNRTGPGTVRSAFGDETTVHEFSRGGGPTITELVGPGETATITTTEGDPADYEVALQRYERVD